MVMMKTNCNKKNSELIPGVTVRVVKRWNRGHASCENPMLGDAHNSANRTQHNLT